MHVPAHVSALLCCRLDKVEKEKSAAIAPEQTKYACAERESVCVCVCVTVTSAGSLQAQHGCVTPLRAIAGEKRPLQRWWSRRTSARWVGGQGCLALLVCV